MTIELECLERVAFAAGRSFESAGPYERLKLRARYAVDPRHALNEAIDDIALAPAEHDGMIRFTGDVSIIKPVDFRRGNGRLLCDLPNRGNHRALQFFNDAPASNRPTTLEDAGNGYLMRRGYSVVTVAWQGDILAGDDRLVVHLPVAGDNNEPVIGKVRAEFVIDRPNVFTVPLSGRISTRSHPLARLDDDKATLSRRRYPKTPAEIIPRSRWCFARTEGGRAPGARLEGDGSSSELAVLPSAAHLYLPEGFEAGWIYELEYEARDPLVHGLGYAALRDLVSFLRYDSARANRILGGEGGVQKAYAWGRSQSGRFIRDFVYRGFNEDTSGRRVFDGVMAHVAGAGRTTPHRFSNLVIAASRQYEDHDHDSDTFPFSYAGTTDHVTGRRDAILKRPATDPLVIHSQTATEYWQRRGSLVHTDTRGNDLEQPESVRVYAWASSQHWADPLLPSPSYGVCQNRINVVWTSMLFRAHLEALDKWATEGTPPPASRYPNRNDGTLVTYEQWREQFPAIPGICLPSSPNDFQDAAQRPSTTGESHGIPSQDRQAHGYAVRVPAVDPDGNDVAGVRAPMVGAPLGTYTGWNLRRRGHGEGAMHDFSGSYVPFADSPGEAEATRDPRRSVLARYGDENAYVEAIRRAATKLVEERLMVDEDLDRVIAAARDWGRPRHDVRLASKPPAAVEQHEPSLARQQQRHEA